MFSYYGSKSKLAKLYPSPKFPLIIEPFAGAAWYSLLHRRSEVLLNEKFTRIYNLWNWLINSATPEVLLKHRNFYLGDRIDQLKISPHHKDLIGFCINRGSVEPRSQVTKWSCQSLKNPNWASTPYSQLTRAANLVSEIRHWEVKYGDYVDLPNVEATWFVDPPYSVGGEHYVKNQINYSELSEWVKSRKGQVIVCENVNATWLDFQPLAEITGQRFKTTEGVWIK